MASNWLIRHNLITTTQCMQSPLRAYIWCCRSTVKICQGHWKTMQSLKTEWMYKHSNFNNLNKLINCHSTDLLITQKTPKQNTNLKCYSKVEPLLGLNLCQNLLRKIRFVNKQVPVCFHWQYKHTKTFFVDVYFVLDAL